MTIEEDNVVVRNYLGQLRVDCAGSSQIGGGHASPLQSHVVAPTRNLSGICVARTNNQQVAAMLHACALDLECEASLSRGPAWAGASDSIKQAPHTNVGPKSSQVPKASHKITTSWRALFDLTQEFARTQRPTG